MRCFVSLLVSLTACAGFACGGLPPDIAEARRLLASGSYPQAEAAAVRAQAAHPGHPEPWRVRIEAAHGAGQARRAVELYEQWYGERQTHGRSHDRVVLERLAFTTLWQGLRVPSAQVRVRAIQAVERLEVEKLADEVAALMVSDDDTVAAAAAVALLRGRPGAPRIATQLLVSDEPAARAIAVAGIGRKIGARARDDLRFSLRDGDARVRLAGIDALAGGHGDDIARFIALAGGDSDARVRARAVVGLGRWSQSAAAEDIAAAARKALDDADSAVRRAALGLLAERGDRATLERIAGGDSPLMALHARAALRRGQSGETASGAETAQLVARAKAAPTFAAEWSQRAELAGVLGALPERSAAVAELRALAGDDDGRVRVAAALALHELGENRAAAELLSAACTDPQPEVREPAIAGHQRAGVLTLGLIRALADESAALRVHAAEAVLQVQR